VKVQHLLMRVFAWLVPLMGPTAPKQKQVLIEGLDKSHMVLMRVRSRA